ncbi:MAG TPA: NAD-dependent epimerase/dehydratase family protein [Myxococcales bacterium]|nr:NAD-dependent epimerase/dehydratase family protein [Myxococcales bacterium]
MSRVLITGAGGFIGAALARRAVADGHEVYAILKSGTDRWRLKGVIEGIRVHEADLRDLDGLRRVVAQSRPHRIYHLAANGAYPFQLDADSIIQSNVLGTWNLLKALGSTDFETFVSAGSSSEYGFKSFAMRETDLPEPNSYYAVSKCAQTMLCQQAARTDKRSINSLRIFSAYGPWEEPSRLVPTLIRRCLDRQELLLVPPDTGRDFVFVDDVVEAFLRVDALSRLHGEVINIGSGVQSTVRDMVDAVLAHTGATVECRWGAMKPRIWDASVWVADCTRARTLLGWRARTTLSDGIARTVAWTRQQRARA